MCRLQSEAQLHKQENFPIWHYEFKILPRIENMSHFIYRISNMKLDFEPAFLDDLFSLKNLNKTLFIISCLV